MFTIHKTHYTFFFLKTSIHTHTKRLIVFFTFKNMLLEIWYCKVTNCGPNPKGIGNGPNKPNTINL